MAQIISSNSLDFLPVDIVPVIASFNDEGRIKPLYVGICGTQYKIDSYWVHKSLSKQLDFHCKLIVDDHLQPVIITYHLNECIWTIPKGG